MRCLTFLTCTEALRISHKSAAVNSFKSLNPVKYFLNQFLFPESFFAVIIYQQVTFISSLSQPLINNMGYK